jgi:hypothetical protein
MPDATSVTSTLPVDRPLGFSESFFHFMHEQGAYVICIGVRLRGPMTEALLTAALRRAQLRHPLLRAHIVEERLRYRFSERGTGAIPLRVLRRESRETFARAMEDEILRPIPSAPHAPRLRVVLIGPTPAVSSASEGEPREPEDAFEIILSMDHAVCDGASVISLVRDILKDAAALASGAALPPVEPLPPLPSLEALLAARGDLPKWKAQAEKNEVPLVPTTRVDGARATRLFFHDVSVAETAKLTERCRAESTSVNGALTAAALIAMQRAAWGSGAVSARLSVISNVALRAQARPPVSVEHVGNFVSYVQTYHAVSADTPFWPLARACREAISAQVAAREAEGRLAPGQLLWWQRGYLRHVAPRIKHGIGNALAISNSGRLPLEGQHGPFALDAVYGSSAQHFIGSSIALFVWSIESGMHLCICYPEPVVSREAATRVSQEMMSLLAGA